MRKRTLESLAKFYGVDNFYHYILDTYINGNFSSVRELYNEMGKDAQNIFVKSLNFRSFAYPIEVQQKVLNFLMRS